MTKKSMKRIHKQDESLESQFRVRRIFGGQYDGWYEILRNGQRIERGGPFAWSAAVKHMRAEIYAIRHAGGIA